MPCSKVSTSLALRESRMPRETPNSADRRSRYPEAPVQIMVIAFAVSILAFGPDTFAAEALSPGVSAALAGQSPTPSRPDSDSTDAERKPEQTRPWPSAASNQGSGSPTMSPTVAISRVSSVVGPKGHFYAVGPTHSSGSRASLQPSRSFRSYAVAHPNVTITAAAALEELGFPEKDRPVLDFSKLPRSAVHRSSP